MASTSNFDELVKRARANLLKQAFVPMNQQGSSQPPPGLPPGTGGPPMMPPGGGMPGGAPGGPPMDPSQGGAPPQDPSQGGGEAPPQDPAAAAGAAGQTQAGMDPSQPVQMSMNDLVQLMQMVQGGGAQPAPAPAPGSEGGKEGGGKSKGGKANVENELKDLRHSIERLISAITGDPSGGGGGGGAAPAPAPADPAAGGGGGDPLGVGGAPAPMGQGMDQAAAPADPQIPGQPAGVPPGMGAEAAPKQASYSAKGRSPSHLGRIISNLKRG